MTLREYIEIISDIDGYIARGGRLLDLPLQDLSPPQQVLLMGRAAPSAIARFGRFLGAMGEQAPGVTEERARAIWSGTILPH